MRIILPIFMLLLFNSCTKDKDDTTDNEQRSPAPVESVEAPTSGTVGIEIEVAVNFRVFNGCGQFDRFTQEISGTTRNIEVQAVYRGDICTQDVPLRTATYKFTPEATGQHTLRFHASDGEYEVVRILVE